MQADIIAVNRTDAVIRMRFFNNTMQPAGLAIPFLMDEGILIGDHFRFNNPRVQYVGMKVKRKPFLDNEIKVLQAGELFYTEIPVDLKRYYRIPADVHSLEVSYGAHHPLDGVGQPTTLVTSPKVSVGKIPEFNF